MKQSNLLILTIVMSTIWSSCKKEDDEITPITVRIETIDSEPMEEGAIATFLLTLSERLNTATVIGYEVAGAATNGTDYEAIVSTITIPANRLNVSLEIISVTDEEEEGMEDVVVTLTGSDNPSVTLSDQYSASITIVDPSPPLPPEEFLPSNVRSYLVNPNATEETAALFYNLNQLSQTQFIVGQQDAFNAFFNNSSGVSDMKKTTGSDPGLLGSDFMFITDDENDGSPSNWFFQQEQIIRGDAIEAYDKGMVNVFAWHLREPYEGDEFYTANMTEFQRTNAFKSILPGGENHDYYMEKLDKVAEVAQSMTGGDGQLVPFIFRPFHEFDGNWFWWGKAYCSAQEFITVWRFTVEYLRDTKNVNNILFAFSPDNQFTTRPQYLERYPGDGYVDVLGMDNYGDFANMGMQGSDQANQKLKIVSDLAIEKVKIAALTESCYFVTPGQNTPIPDFYSQHLYHALTGNEVQIGFMMFWYNSQDTYCVPPPGQSATADFIEFIDKPASVLANDLPDMYTLPEDPV